MNAVIYTRVSTEDQAQQGYSLDSQKRELRELARRKGYRVVAELSDDGVSGATLDRPALTTLRDGARAGRYGVVLVHAPDRLARRLALQLVMMEEFKKAGVRVEFLTAPTEDSAEGRLQLNVLGILGEYEREKIRERTTRGKLEKARQGKYVQPSSAPFGYRPDPARAGQLVVYEPEADVIRLIHRMCVEERKSTRGIVMELRRLGIRSARGRWTCPQVRRMLIDGYAGTRYYNQTGVQADGRSRLRDEDQWVAISLPAIVTPEQHAAARAQLDRNRLALVGRPPNQFYLLRSLLTCSVCHRRYRGSGSPPRRTYKHQNGERALACAAANKSLVATRVEDPVRASITAALSDPAVLRRGVEAYELRRAASDVELRSAVTHLQQQIDKVRADERRLINLVVGDREQQGVVEAKLRELAEQRGGLVTRLQAAEMKALQHGATVAPDHVAAVCAQAMRGLGQLDRDGWRALLAEIVDEVAVLPDNTLEIRGLIPTTILERAPRPE
jgi:site-specific DNA recombinase